VSRTAARLWLVLASTLGALAIAEAALRYVACAEAGIDSFSAVRERYLGNPLAIFPMKTRVAGGLEPGKTVGNRMRVNGRGFRGRDVSTDKQSGRVRVVCLGGSSVFGTTSTGDAKTWPAQLQFLANRSKVEARIEVLNGGVPGYISPHSVDRFETMFLPLDCDVVVLSNLHNDLLDSRIVRLGYDPRETAPVTVDGWAERVLSHSAIWLRLVAWRTHRAKSENVEQIAKVADGDLRRKLMRQVTDRESGATYNPYLIPADVAKYRGTLERLVRVAEEAGIASVLCTQPLSFRVSPPGDVHPKADTMLGIYFPEFRKFCEAYQAYNDVVREVAADTSATLFDAEEVMPRDAVYFKDHVHYTDIGCRQYAQLLLDRLIETDLLSTR